MYCWMIRKTRATSIITRENSSTRTK